MGTDQESKFWTVGHIRLALWFGLCVLHAKHLYHYCIIGVVEYALCVLPLQKEFLHNTGYAEARGLAPSAFWIELFCCIEKHSVHVYIMDGTVSHAVI